MDQSGPIIVIDDDTDDHEIIKIAATGANIQEEMYFFKEGKEAINFLLTTPVQPLLILCDIKLHVTTGIDLRKTILDHPVLKKKSIPFLYFSTEANPKEVDMAYEMCVQGYFKKPYDLQQYQDQLKKIVTYWKECLHPNNL